MTNKEKELSLEIKYLKEKVELLEKQILFMEKYLAPTPVKITHPAPYYYHYPMTYPTPYDPPSYPTTYPIVTCGEFSTRFDYKGSTINNIDSILNRVKPDGQNGE